MRGFSGNPKGLLVVHRTDDFDLNAAVLSTAFSSFVVCNWLLLAFTFGVDAVFLNAFRHEISFDRLRAADRQLLIVSVAAYNGLRNSLLGPG